MTTEPLPSYAPKKRRPRPVAPQNPDAAKGAAAPLETSAQNDPRAHKISSAPQDRESIPRFAPQVPRKSLKSEGAASPASASATPDQTPSPSPGSAPAFPTAGRATTAPAAPVKAPASNSTDHQSSGYQSFQPRRVSQPNAGGGGITPPPSIPPKRRRPGRTALRVILALLLAVLLWVGYLFFQVNSNLGRQPGLSSLPPGSATTYLIAGSDARGDGGAKEDGTVGERTDSLMLVVKGANGTSSVISLPRDTDVQIPGHGNNKLNAAYTFGGPPLLVQTVEGLIGFKVDHFVLVKMGGVAKIVDAVGGVELCLDFDVDDPKSELHWQAGCHQADGKTALAFARMRYQDPRGDLGRQDRQRQVISKTLQKGLSPSTMLNPVSASRLAKAGASALVVDTDTSPFSIAKLALAYRSANNAGLSGIPPIESLNYRNGHGSAVLLDQELAPQFFQKAEAGTLSPEDFYQK